MSCGQNLSSGVNVHYPALTRFDSDVFQNNILETCGIKTGTKRQVLLATRQLSVTLLVYF